MKYEYRNFKIVITEEKKWGYGRSENGSVFTWEVQHTGGWRLEYSNQPHETEAQCKQAAEKAVDKLYGY